MTTTKINQRYRASGSRPRRPERLAESSGSPRIRTIRRKESQSAAAYSYTVLLQPEPEGGYTVTCPTLPELVTCGEALEETRAMAADAIRGYIEYLREDGEPIPRAIPRRHPWLIR
jgi:antitoxin HicB